ncbi:MAG: nucleotidyltransferase domain-containing protein [Desulfurococcus sp.]|nr:nucleotidyltransferase domain-containing protein [Desulfurococcus sp.]
MVVADELQKIVGMLVERFKPKAIILFGSRARGDWVPWSDYDLLIIADFENKYLDRIKIILDLLGDTVLNIEPHPYTLEEAVQMLSKGNPIIVNAIEEGIVLYSTSEYEILLEKYRELREKGLRRTHTTVILPDKL